MKISVYMEALAYRYGGAEAYASAVIESLQLMFPCSTITLITEHLKGRKKLSVQQILQMQNEAYGTSISASNFSVEYFDFQLIYEHLAKNKISRLLSIIRKELYENFRFRKVQELSCGSDVFINCSRVIVGGLARKNICIVHFPKSAGADSGINRRISFFRKKAEFRDFAYENSYDLYLPNSIFTDAHLREMWSIPEFKTRVLYPPVKTIHVKRVKNPAQILLCSRICRLKKIDVILRGLATSDFLTGNARILVAGSAISEDASFVESLRNEFPKVEFHCDPTRPELEDLYAASGIFVHAMGYGEESPQNFEHFGITTVEAMSAGCVPVVIDKGGQREIVSDGFGFRWNTIREMVEKTEWLVKNPAEAERIREKAIKRGSLFCKENFHKKFSDYVLEVLNA